jgi:hypothetical protein
MLQQVQGTQQQLIDIRRGAAVGLSMREQTEDGTAMFLEYLDERKFRENNHRAFF